MSLLNPLILLKIEKDDFLRRFDECIDQFGHKGEYSAEFIITENGKEIARLVEPKDDEKE